MATLVEVIGSLGGLPVHDDAELVPTIFARKPWTPQSPCVVLAEETVDGRAGSAPDYAYLLEVDSAHAVLQVWSDWRADATPSADQATLAVSYYAENDAFEPSS